MAMRWASSVGVMKAERGCRNGNRHERRDICLVTAEEVTQYQISAGGDGSERGDGVARRRLNA
jgi:hypothetical protein